jgi:hypothetical protein
VPRQDDHHRAELNALGATRHEGQELHRIGDHLVVGEVMFGRPHRIEAQLLGEIAEMDFFFPDVAVRPGAVRILERRGVPDLHCFLPKEPCVVLVTMMRPPSASCNAFTIGAPRPAAFITHVIAAADRLALLACDLAGRLGQQPNGR